MKVHIQIQGDDFNFEDDISMELAGYLISKVGTVKAVKEQRATKGIFVQTDWEIIRDNS